MKKSRFSEAQIVGILKEVEMGLKAGTTPGATYSVTALDLLCAARYLLFAMFVVQTWH